MRKNSRASVHLDALRAVAAMIVVVCHWRYFTFSDGLSLTLGQKVALGPACFMAWAAPLAVMVFFVLSGYLISGSVLKGMRAGTFSMGMYGCHRLIRLWVVLIPALFVGGMVDFIGMHHAAAYGLYSGLVHDHEALNVFNRFNAASFFSSLLFLQTIHGNVFGSNAPLWSVAFEFWYYVLFPLGFVMLSPKFSLRRRIVCTVCFAAVSIFVGFPVLELFPLWLLGFGIHFLPRLSLSHLQRAGFAVGYGMVFSAMVFATRLSMLAQMSTEIKYVVGLSTALFIWTLLSSTEPRQKSLYTSSASSFAAFSYSLYVIHFPVLMLFTAFVLGSHRWSPTPGHFAISVAGLLGSILVAFGVHKLFEVHTALLQKTVERVFTRPPIVREPIFDSPSIVNLIHHRFTMPRGTNELASDVFLQTIQRTEGRVEPEPLRLGGVPRL